MVTTPITIIFNKYMILYLGFITTLTCVGSLWVRERGYSQYISTRSFWPLHKETTNSQKDDSRMRPKRTLGSHVQPSTYVRLEGNNLVTVKTRCNLVHPCHTYYCGPPMNSEYQHWLQTMALIHWTKFRSCSYYHRLLSA